MNSELPEHPDPPSMAYRCPRCHNENPQEERENNPGPDRWFNCPQCGYRWSVSPIADS